MIRRIPLFFVFVVLTALILSACQSSRPDSKSFDPSAEHLQLKSAQKTMQQTAIPSVNVKVPYLPKPRAKKFNDLYSISVVQAPVKDVLFKLARDAALDVDIMDNTDGIITLNALDQTLPVIIRRLNEQTGLNIVLEPGRLVVQADKAYWVNYPIDYVNLDRYSQSTVLLANAVGKNSQGSATASLGASNGQTPKTVSFQGGSSVAILNISQHELWKTLGTGIMRTLRAMYPTLGPALADGAAESLKPNNASDKTVDSGATSKLSSDPLSALTGVGNTLPAPEQQIGSTPLVYSPYPEAAPVSNYVTLVRESGFVAVYAPSRAHKEVQKYIDQMMSGGRRQVMIEATVVEVELNNENQSGVNWSALASDGTFGLSQAYSGRDQLDVTSSASAGLVSVTGSSLSKEWSLTSTLKMLERFGNSRVLSSPKMVGINNQPTLLKVVKNLIYFSVNAQVTPGALGQASTRAYSTTPNSVPVGLVMSVLPSISENNEITLVVRPTISTLSGYVSDPNPDLVDAQGNRISNLVPIIQEREMESVLKLNDGQIAILGGLIQDTVVDEDTGIPGLVGQPAVGYLFGQKNAAKRKSELVIFLKPVLVAHPDIENGSLADKKHLLPKLSVDGASQ